MRILFVHNSLRTFVRVDRDLLAEQHEVDEMDLSDPRRIATLPARLPAADLVFSWFASLHSFFPAVSAAGLRKPVVSIVGAYDAANVPEIGFGHMGHPWKRYVVRAICGASRLLIANSDYAVETIRRNVRPQAPIRRIYHGFRFADGPVPAEREPLALSVGEVRHVNLLRKGHEVFTRAAALLPEVRFVLAGPILDGSGEYLRGIAPPNLELRGSIPAAELEDLYRRASVYVQPSVHESFGMAVAEAMGWGALPVVSRQGALPEVAGSHGIYLDEQSPESVAAGIRAGLGLGSQERDAAAAWVRERFPLQARRQGLQGALREAVGREG